MRNGILALSLAIATAQAPAQGWAEKMFKELSHDFGTQPRGTQMRYDFTVTNIYAVRMEITEIKSGCGCVTATVKKRVLEPRETTVLEVRMDGRRFAGAKTVGVRVSVGPEFISSAELRISANCRSDVVLNPGEANFGSVTRGQAATQTIDVEYAGKLAWQVSEVVAKDVPYTVAIKELYRRQAGANQQVGYRLTVTLKPDAPLGMNKHEVYLKTNDPASPTVAVLLESNVQTAVTVSPPALNLGPVKGGTALIRRVVVKGNRPFHILAVEGVGSGIELGAPLATTDAPVQFVTFRCQFANPGKFARELKIKTTLQDAPVSVTIDGEATK
jgi:hypothetical protein